MKFILCSLLLLFLNCESNSDYLSQLKQPVRSDDYTILAAYDLEIPKYSAEVVEVRIRNHNYMLFFGYDKGGMCHSEDCPCRLKFNE